MVEQRSFKASRNIILPMNGTTPPSPTVSVCVLCFNHVEFIEQTIESILSQKCNYGLEVVITDNCSTDGTQKILLSYQQKHPDTIQLFLEPKPISFVENIQAYFTRTRGRYIAILDGDDYWSFPNKLEEQISFLENNADFNGCFHDARIIHQVDRSSPRKFAQSFHSFRAYSQINHYPSVLFPEHIITRTIVPSSSLVFRKTTEMQAFAHNCPLKFDLSADWLGVLGVIRGSKMKYFNYQWSAYRDHSVGISKGVPSFRYHESNIAILRHLLNDPFYGQVRYKYLIHHQMAKESVELYNLNYTATKTVRIQYTIMHLLFRLRESFAFFNLVVSSLKSTRLDGS